MDEHVISIQNVRADHTVARHLQQKCACGSPVLRKVNHVLDVLGGEQWGSGRDTPDDGDSTGPAVGGRQRSRLKSLFLQKTFPLNRRNVVLDRRRINIEMPADFADRRWKAVGIRVFIDEIEYRLLSFGKHAALISEQVYGSQGWILKCGRPGVSLQSQSGAALILAVLLLFFLGALGGALLTSTTLDIWIAGNFKTRVQSQYAAESGIERAREVLRVTGPSGLQTPLTGGDENGTYEVSLQNGIAGDVWTLVSVAETGNSRKTIEVMVRKGAFPSNPLDPQLASVRDLERLAGAITRNANDRWEGSAAIGNYGSSADYRVAAVDGDCTLGPGTGYGVLLVRGELTLSGGFSWTGLILVIGQGAVHWDAGAIGQITGGLFAAQTRDPSGNALPVPGSVTFDQNDATAILKANALFPYTPISYREY
jgi:hypothetical protein